MNKGILANKVTGIAVRGGVVFLGIFLFLSSIVIMYAHIDGPHILWGEWAIKRKEAGLDKGVILYVEDREKGVLKYIDIYHDSLQMEILDYDFSEFPKDKLTLKKVDKLPTYKKTYRRIETNNYFNEEADKFGLKESEVYSTPFKSIRAVFLADPQEFFLTCFYSFIIEMVFLVIGITLLGIVVFTIDFIINGYGGEKKDNQQSL
ncbi:hypothetical protein P7D73_20755 [Enterococcus raffinosus]|uniref:hypothetical protein n=1 Tax=Enterococcus TaxID=1350 RepID=UPI002890EBA1|nr:MULTISPECIES: hypothetical protein [Enterococcus]MDT2482652.1 hypothetical protein [Enterococcus avium]MDT2509348.1 hypothetical protein [Enterococcus avium]MDT2525675.1 hypothetical protein [Enterococcus raffinosus]MDT2536210.1 hypothetical protein [Enterococcus raffinosus]MDT2579993.1 hypothetical protein [Enterococcus raffinosus]